MNTTKRKFNALLQGLSPRPRSSDGAVAGSQASKQGKDPTGTTYESLVQKRRRLGLPEPPKPSSQFYGGRANTIPPSAEFVRRDKSLDQTKARYCPSDREELLKRLVTFQDITDWTPKPEKISEIQWAKRGWVCQGKERVRCMLCHKEVVVRLQRQAEESVDAGVTDTSELGKPPKVRNPQGEKRADYFFAEESFVIKYTELIVTSHQQECLWQKRGCDGTYESPQVY